MSNLRLILDGDALVANWRALDAMSGAATAGAAVKADGYGLGARACVMRLAAAGCRDFYVAHWDEAAAIADLVPPDRIAVLHGVAPGEIEAARAIGAVPVLNSPAQIGRWRDAGGGRCHVMIDTGMSRLGIAPGDMGAALFAGLEIEMAMSHLASADEDSPQNETQRRRFDALRGMTGAARFSLANSAGIALGSGYHYDATRPGLALYGGVPHPALTDRIAPVVSLSARLLQVRTIAAGDSVGYGATFTAPRPMRIGAVALGYADGYKRDLAGSGMYRHAGVDLPLLGRVSMDLSCIDLTAAPQLGEGDWVEADFDLARAEAASGISAYELLSHLGHRFERIWH